LDFASWVWVAASLISLVLYFVPAWLIRDLSKRKRLDKGAYSVQDNQNIDIRGREIVINGGLHKIRHHQVREKDETGRSTRLTEGLTALLTAILDNFLR
jgi:hypothetical protein